MDAILTVATGTDFCRNPYLQVFFKSLSKCGYKGDVIVFTHDMSEDIRQIVQGYGYEIVEIDPTKIVYILHDRFYFYYEFLTKRKYDRVLLVDVKDVLFQDNPFKDAPENEPFVWFAGEGGVHSQSGWNTNDQRKCQLEMKAEYRHDLSNQPVLNGGTILGTNNEIRSLCLLIWTQILRTEHQYTDQAALNYVYSILKNDPIYTVLMPQEDSWAATGQGINEGWFKPHWINGKLWSLNCPYFLFHQWDRTEYKDLVLEKMGLVIRKFPEPERLPPCHEFEKAVISFK